MRRPAIADAAVAAVVALGVAAPGGPAVADDADLFGFDPRPVPAPVDVDCADATASACAFATDPLAARTGSSALARVIAAARWRDLPFADLDHDAAVALALGAARDGAGPGFGGATGLDNRWSVEGAPIDSLRTGGLESRIPLAFVERIVVTAGGFTAADRASIGGTIDVDLVRGGVRHEVRAEAWGSTAADRDALPAAPLRYDPITTAPTAAGALSAAIVARGPLARIAGSRTWYAVGVRPVIRDDGVVRDARRLTDLGGDGLPDLDGGGVPITEAIDHRTFRELAYAVPVLARLGAERGRHRLELTALATAYRDTRWFAMATEAAAGIRRSGAILDGVATWTARWPRTRARVVASWHRSQYDERPRQGTAATPQLLTAFIPRDLPGDAALAAACDDTRADDPYPAIPNCPVPRGLFASDGAGLLFGETADRPAVTAEVARGAGDHTVTAGVTGEDGRLVTRRRYTGGLQVRRLFTGFDDVIRFVEVGTGPDTFPCDDDPLVTDRCRVIDESAIGFRTRQLAAYLGDDWRPRRDVSFTGGVRWESMQLGDAFAFRDQVAPRVGAAWDFAGRGRSRLFVGFGRSYAAMPAGMGDDVVARAPTRRELDTIVIYDAGGTLGVAADLAPVVVEELAGGAEVVSQGVVRVAAWAQLRWQRRGIETVAGELTNPVAPPATRAATVLAAELATSTGGRLDVRVQWQWTRSTGAAPGAFDPRDGNVLYAGAAYDTAVDSANLVGLLPTDLRHRATFEGVARARLGPVPVVIALRAQLAQGRPTDARANTGNGTIFLIPRGSHGRLGQTTTANLHLAARLGGGVELVADVFNVFHRQRATAVDDIYTEADVRPIDRGSPEDLVFLKDASGSAAPRTPGFGRATARQSPFAAAIGVRTTFW